jgi:hypothetical protein
MILYALFLVRFSLNIFASGKICGFKRQYKCIFKYIWELIAFYIQHVDTMYIKILIINKHWCIICSWVFIDTISRIIHGITGMTGPLKYVIVIDPYIRQQYSVPKKMTRIYFWMKRTFTSWWLLVFFFRPNVIEG